MADIWLLIIFAIPIIAAIFLKVNSVVVFMGLCLGYILSQFDGTSKEITKLASSSKFIEHFDGSNNIHLILLLLPPLILLLFTIKSVTGKKYSIKLLPAIATGFLAVITVVPLLPLKTSLNIMSTSFWRDVTKYQGGLVAASVLIVIVILIYEHSKIRSSLSKGKHSKSKAA